jgi:hypothetical protein
MDISKKGFFNRNQSGRLTIPLVCWWEISTEHKLGATEYGDDDISKHI